MQAAVVMAKNNILLVLRRLMNTVAIKKTARVSGFLRREKVEMRERTDAANKSTFSTHVGRKIVYLTVRAQRRFCVKSIPESECYS